MRISICGRFALCVLLISPTSAQDISEYRAQLAHERATHLLMDDAGLQYDPGSILVQWYPSQAEEERTAMREVVGSGVLKRYSLVPDLELIHITTSVQEAIEALGPFTKFAEPNYVVRHTNIPNDSLFVQLYGLHNTGQTVQGVAGVPDADIDAAEAWDVFTGDANFKIAIIDTGTDWDHPDLAANIWINPGEIAGNGIDDDANGFIDDVRGWDFFSNDNNPDDSGGHGTHTAGTVGAVGNNAIGVTGVNWQCKLVPLRFLGPTGGFTSDAVSAVQYCTTNNIKVSNNSWGGGGFSQALFNAIQASQAVGHVFCAAAGNSGSNNDISAHYPSNYSLVNVLSVAATDNRDLMASFSSFGSVSVDLGAPGVNTVSTYLNGGYASLSGTSMATPHVAGVVGLVYAQNPTWTWQQVVDRILTTTRPTAAMNGRVATGGVLNAAAALTGGGGGGDVTPPATPTGLAATGGDGVVDLTWVANTEPDLAGYRLFRSTVSGSGHVEISTGLITASTFSDVAVTNGTTYFYVLRADDITGNQSGDSLEASATPSAGTGGGTPSSLASDGFESNNFNGGAGAWLGSWANSQARILANNPHSGSFNARVRKSNGVMRRTCNLAGANSIHLTFWGRAAQFKGNDQFLIMVSVDGAPLTTLETITAANSDNIYHFHDIDLSGLAMSANVLFEFRSNMDKGFFFLDDLDVIGITGPPPPDIDPPAVSVTSPTEGASVNGTVSFTANATDNVSVTQVEFLVDGLVIATDATAPYGTNWNSDLAALGAHVLMARATDPAGNVGASAGVNVTVTSPPPPDLDPPVVSVTNPLDGATVEGFVTIAATASDNVSVEQVEFLVDGLVIATDATAPYSTSWNSSQSTVGLHVLTARATDPSGNTGTSTTISVTVTTPPPPSLTLTLTGWPGVANRGDQFTGSAIITNTGGTNASGLVASVSWSPSNALRFEQGGPNNNVPTVVAGGSQTTGWSLKADRETPLATITVTLSEASGNVIATETTTMVILK